MTLTKFIRSAHVFGRTSLSNRELEIAELVSKGQSNKEVATALFVTEKTVKFHLTNIYKKFKIKSRAQLIVLSLAHQPGAMPQEMIEDVKPAPIEMIPMRPRLPEGNA